MSIPKRTVMITGCSDGGLGAALAVAFHNAGLEVYATARNPAKMAVVASHGIKTLPLDVLSAASIAACVEKLPSLDILVNNAGAGYHMPMSDLDIDEAKRLFDLNVWAHLAVTKAMLPLLMKSKGMIVNHTSSSSVAALPFQGAYNASKAAMSMFSDTLRLELRPFDIRVANVKTGVVSSRFFDNKIHTTALPKDSLYQPAKTIVEKVMGSEGLKGAEGTEPEVWAEQVVKDLLRSKPPMTVWRGAQAGLISWGTILPSWLLDFMARQMTGFDEVERLVRS
ncbi:hypothetical protein EMPG_16853 [Blastomyces silverae]|uniref:1-acylglycerone phosphate reductase n=1 Tax=Blastomyces silverae TaxID=2060906 RepID=A0A0H1B9H8_9EURO|nr:hypothetical protein EMPG_16853 [Blastomyces silverae]